MIGEDSMFVKRLIVQTTRETRVETANSLDTHCDCEYLWQKYYPNWCLFGPKEIAFVLAIT